MDPEVLCCHVSLIFLGIGISITDPTSTSHPSTLALVIADSVVQHDSVTVRGPNASVSDAHNGSSMGSGSIDVVTIAAFSGVFSVLVL